MSARFVSERLGKLSRAGFTCGDTRLGTYLQQHAGQDEKRRLARVFVLREAVSGLLAGFYTLSAISLLPATLPLEMAQRLPRYDQIPAVLIGRLAVDLRFQGTGLGGMLIMDAIARIEAIDVGVHLILVDAYESAQGFYSKFGFQPLPDNENRMFLPMQTAIKALRQP